MRFRSSRMNAIVVDTGGSRARRELVVDRRRPAGQRLAAARCARGQRPAQRRAGAPACTGSRRSRCPGGSTARSLSFVVLDRELEPVAEDLQLLVGELLRLVGDVAALDARAERPALDGLGEDHRRRAAEVDRRGVRRVDLAVVVAAAAELREVVVGEVRDELLRAAGRARRSARGCTRRPRRENFWNSPSSVVFICGRGRRRCRARAARPTRGPRRP